MKEKASLQLFSLGGGDDCGDAGVAHDVDARPGHVENSIDSCHKGGALKRKSDGGQHEGSMMSPAPGTPAVPMAARVAVSTMFIWAPMVRGRP